MEGHRELPPRPQHITLSSFAESMDDTTASLSDNTPIYKTPLASNDKPISSNDKSTSSAKEPMSPMPDTINTWGVPTLSTLSFATDVGTPIGHAASDATASMTGSDHYPHQPSSGGSTGRVSATNNDNTPANKGEKGDAEGVSRSSTPEPASQYTALDPSCFSYKGQSDKTDEQTADVQRDECAGPPPPPLMEAESACRREGFR